MNKQNIKQQLRKSSLALALVAGLGVGVLCALPKAQASQPAPVSGTFTLCGHNIWDSLHIAGRNLTIDAYQNQIFYGLLAGTLYITPENPEHDVVRLADDGVTLLRVYFHGSGTFAGSVLGRTASTAAVMSYTAQIAPDGTGYGTWTFDDPVAGIHGRGTLPTGNPPDPNPCEGDGYYVTGTYAGQIQLTP
jgi:hypothetical protein